MDWVPIVFIVFKVLVLGTGMFFAIKWHYDQGKKVRPHDTRSVLRSGAAVAAVFVLSAAGLLYLTFSFAKWIGIDLTLP